MILNICKEFTDTPGARYKKEGKFSGEKFLQELLEPSYLEVRKNNEKLIVDLDGGYGYPTSFLEEAFGGLARKYGVHEVLETLVIVSEDEPALVSDIKDYIFNTLNKK